MRGLYDGYKLVLFCGAALFVFCPTVASTAYSAQSDAGGEIKVNCDKGHSVQDALDVSIPGTVLKVSGICSESLSIETDRVSLVGNPSATLVAPGIGTTTLISVKAQGVLIKDFVVDATGVPNGVSIAKNSEAELIGVEVIAPGDTGIIVGSSSATLRQTEVVDAARIGVLARDGASISIFGGRFSDSFIGVSARGNSSIVASGSAVSSTQFGMSSQGSSYVELNDTEIAQSAIAGLFLQQSSAAEVFGSAFDMSGNGIQVQTNSSLFIPLFPDDTSITNSTNGIVCSSSGALEIQELPNFGGNGNNLSIAPGCEAFLPPP